MEKIQGGSFATPAIGSAGAPISRLDKKRLKAAHEKRFQLLVATLITNLIFAIGTVYLLYRQHSMLINSSKDIVQKIADDDPIESESDNLDKIGDVKTENGNIIDFSSFLFAEVPFKTLLFHSVLSGFCIYSVTNSIRDGLTYEYYFDVLGLNLFIQLFGLLTSTVYYLYWIVPFFVVYKLWGFISPFIFRQQPGELEVQDSKKGSKKAKEKNR